MSLADRLNPMARHRSRCRQVRAEMSDYLDGELDRPAARLVQRHVRWCPSCRRMLANLRRTVDGLNALGKLGPSDPSEGRASET